MYYDDDVYVFLTYVASQPRKGTPKHVSVIFGEVPDMIGHLDIGHLIETCLDRYGYLQRLPTIMNDSATVWLTGKGTESINQQRRSRK